MGIVAISRENNQPFNTHKNAKIKDLWVSSPLAKTVTSPAIPIKPRKSKIYGYSPHQQKTKSTNIDKPICREYYLDKFLNRLRMAFEDTFKAMSDPVRRQILTMLKDGMMSAGDIASHFDMTNATVSYHLSVLKKADLIYEKKEKNFIYYGLNISIVEEMMLWLSDLKGDKEGDKERNKEEKKEGDKENG